jgi:amino acid transporter
MITFQLKRLLIGSPFPTSREKHERLDKKRALAIFASDPISSNAYATEAIMTVLVIMGSGALGLTWPIGLLIAGLVLAVVFSYTQTIRHYPDGGGAYIVAKDNLGTTPALVAGAALLVDYVLTVSVSVSAGVRAVTSAFPELHDWRVWLALGAIVFITWINLRGIRDSGTFFALPTYAFVGGVLLVIMIGFVRYLGLLGAAPLPAGQEIVDAARPVSNMLFIWLVLRAFAAGCTALTGIEAISNGVPAFKQPEAKNAIQTMVVMGVIAMSLFLGITFLATQMSLVPEEAESILSQMTRAITGGGPLYIWVQTFTALILFLAANTGYQDFPRLGSYLARDRFLPRWIQNRGDRLVFSSGIIALMLLSCLVVLVFQADEIAMLPLYALGVMLSFTLSQVGMFRLMGRIAHLRPGESLNTGVTTVHYETGIGWKRFINGSGALLTGIVFIILVVTKFLEGAWIIALAIPLLVFMFYAVRRHYQHVSTALSIQGLATSPEDKIGNIAIVPIGDVHRGTLQALAYAGRLADDVRAVSICTSPEMRDRIQQRWQLFPELTGSIKLVLIDYEYRDILHPLVDYIEQVKNSEFPSRLTTVVVPEIVPTSIAAQFLHNQTANLLRMRLRQERDVVVIDIPYHVDG